MSVTIWRLVSITNKIRSERAFSPNTLTLDIPRPIEPLVPPSRLPPPMPPIGIVAASGGDTAEIALHISPAVFAQGMEHGTMFGAMGGMGGPGMDFEDEVLRIYPDFPRRDVPRTWEHYIPELSPLLTKLVETHA